MNRPHQAHEQGRPLPRDPLPLVTLAASLTALVLSLLALGLALYGGP